MRIPVLFAEGLALPSSVASSSPFATNIPLPVISFILYSEQGFLDSKAKHIQMPRRIKDEQIM
jgi:hypothetical protein